MWIEIVSQVWDGESLLKPKPVKFKLLSQILEFVTHTQTNIKKKT